MNGGKTLNWLNQTALKAFISLILLAYCTMRVYSLSMTYDESATVLDFVYRPLSFILTNEYASANNHILNTLLIKLFILIEDTPFWVRLPNLLALILYLYSASKLTHRLFNKASISIMAFVLLSINPYLLDFFSLGRGYGLSLGFMMASMYAWHLFSESLHQKKLRWALAFAILATYSNFTMLNYYLAIGALTLIVVVAKSDKPLWKGIRPTLFSLFASTIVLAGLIWVPLSALIKNQALYYGGKKGFFKDSFYSLIENGLYGRWYFGMDIKQWIVYIFLALTFISLAISIWKAVQHKKISAHLNWSLLLSIMILGSILQHYLLGTRFLINRTSLIYWPVLALIWSYGLKYFPWPFRLIFTIAICLHLYYTANFKYVREWWYDRFTEDVVEYVISQHPNDTVTIGGKWLYALTMEYYKQARSYNHFQGPGRKQEVNNSTNYDYFYIDAQDKGKLHPSYKLEKQFGSNMLLMKKED